MRRVVVHEGDRVIRSVLAGPHERIIDPDLYEIWKDMRWRGIVKARHLILAIHDYYLQKLDDQRHDSQLRRDESAARCINEEDVWTLDYLDLMHLQPILEAFDDDVSGFVTIQEVNHFTTSRPQGWSLLHWLAYWAIGWQVSMTAYKRKIYSVLALMHALAISSRHANQKKITSYLSDVRPLIDSLTSAFRENTEQSFLLARFRTYIEQEEARLRKRLETAKYDLDALDTLVLINGRVGLERNVFPLVYLLLLHHYEIMRIGQEYILHPDELSDAMASLETIRDAFDLRRDTLTALFQQRRLMATQELDEFAGGMFSNSLPGQAIGYIGQLNDSLLLNSGNPADLPATARNSVSVDLLKYPPHSEDFYPASEDGLQDWVEPDDVDEAVRAILGPWTGIIHTTTSEGSDDMETGYILNFSFHASPQNPKGFLARPTLYWPWMCTRTDCVGEAGVGPDGQYSYTVTVTPNSSLLGPTHVRLRLRDDGMTLTGDMDYPQPDLVEAPTDDKGSRRNQVTLKRNSSPVIMACYPSPSSIVSNKSAALWKFAISATIATIRQRTLTWSVLKGRRDRRHRLASLIYYDSTSAPWNTNLSEQNRLMDRISPADLHFIAFAALEPERFAWLLPPCSARPGECMRLLSTLVPCLRCIAPACAAYNDDAPPAYASHGFVICDDPDCLLVHHSSARERFGEPEGHCVVKTRVIGWTLSNFLATSGRTVPELLERAAYLTNLLSEDRDERVLDRGRNRWPSGLSTIPEGSELGDDLDNGDTGDDDDGDRTFVGADSQASLGFGLQGEFVSEPETFEGTPVTEERGGDGSTGSDGSAGELRVVNLERGGGTRSLIPRQCDAPQASDSPRSVFVKGSPRFCVVCEEAITLPCWTCAECTDLLSICTSCDGSARSGAVVSASHINIHHEATHTLLYVPALSPALPPVMIPELPPIPGPRSPRAGADRSPPWHDHLFRASSMRNVDSPPRSPRSSFDPSGSAPNVLFNPRRLSTSASVSRRSSRPRPVLLSVADGIDSANDGNHDGDGAFNDLVSPPAPQPAPILSYHSRIQDDDDEYDAYGTHEYDNTARLSAVENRLSTLEGRFEAVEDGVARVERMMEGLLAMLRPSPATARNSS
ncbi:hypothetical protein C8Q76DRAFT_710506 [Earliella scabrosa]|nr:hypothetical protein C8Q76DRAFT_710506 [Earliella scabrosa]